MKKHASSHGLALLVCTVTAGILIGMGRDHYPTIAQNLEDMSVYIVTLFNLEFPPKAISILIIAVILAVFWGIAFSFMHSDKKSDKD